MVATCGLLLITFRCSRNKGSSVHTYMRATFFERTSPLRSFNHNFALEVDEDFIIVVRWIPHLYSVCSISRALERYPSADESRFRKGTQQTDNVLLKLKIRISTGMFNLLRYLTSFQFVTLTVSLWKLPQVNGFCNSPIFAPASRISRISCLISP